MRHRDRHKSCRLDDFEVGVKHAASQPIIQAVAAGDLVATVAIMPIDVAPQAAAGGRAGGPSRETAQPIIGRLADGSLVTGAISNLRSSVVDGKLQLTGTLTCADPSVGSQQFAQSLSLSQLYVNNACSVLILDLGQLSLDGSGSTFSVIPVELSAEPQATSGSANLLPAMFGWLAGFLDNEGPVEGISTLLNRILTSLGLRH